MGPCCDFCGEQRAMVYCKSDVASLCLSCDRNVHSANALSRRHSRTLLCDRCSTLPAIVRCMEENLSLCQNCDWNGHGGLASGHKRQAINCYSGCPSAAELSRIWSFVLEFPPMADSNCEQGMGLMSINENSVSNFWGAPENSSTIDIDSAGKMSDNKINPWNASSSTSAADPMLCSGDQPTGSVDSTTRKVYEGFKIPIYYQILNVLMPMVLGSGGTSHWDVEKGCCPTCLDRTIPSSSQHLNRRILRHLLYQVLGWDGMGRQHVSFHGKIEMVSFHGI